MYISKQKIIVVAVILVLCIGSLIAYAHFKNQPEAPATKEVTETSEVAPAPETALVTSVTPVTTTPIVTTPTKPVTPSLPPLPVGTDQFTVSLTATSPDIAASLLAGGYITDAAAFSGSVGDTAILPGAYKISKEMTPAQLLQVLRGKPYMKWIVIPPGLRKEEIADLLSSSLGWTAAQKKEWITKDTTTKPEYIEGVYAPNTYLIPVAETQADVAARLIAKFNEGFSYYLPQFTAKNIKWTSALTLASIVEREAANTADMPLIAGILWNRLNQNMPLDVDATLQYVRGNTGNGWWAPISVADKKTDSPYNTYLHTGLPPHPISNPSLAAIEAVLNPIATDCLYYLHDKNHVTHCAATYEEHQKNIELYLKAPQS